jgi:hypothetical protein
MTGMVLMYLLMFANLHSAPAIGLGHGGPTAEDIQGLGAWVEKHCRIKEVEEICPIGGGKPVPCGYVTLKLACDKEQKP